MFADQSPTFVGVCVFGGGGLAREATCGDWWREGGNFQTRLEHTRKVAFDSCGGGRWWTPERKVCTRMGCIMLLTNLLSNVCPQSLECPTRAPRSLVPSLLHSLTQTEAQTVVK